MAEPAENASRGLDGKVAAEGSGALELNAAVEPTASTAFSSVGTNQSQARPKEQASIPAGERLPVGRVLSADARSFGTCFLISNRHVVTAAHCVAAALEMTTGSRLPNDASVFITFSPNLSKVRIAAKVIKTDEQIDVAILELNQDTPFDQFRMAKGQPNFPLDAICWGYLGDEETATAIRVSIITSNTDGYLVAEILNPSTSRFAGFSGAPAVGASGAVLGMVVLSRIEPRQLYLLPAAQVAAFFGEQAELSQDVGQGVSNAEKQQGETVSNALGLSREPPETALRLNFKEYALAISRVFRDANGEFCMALVGRWGAGKTRLARLLINYMTKPEYFVSELDQYGLPHAVTDSMRDSAVWFSAFQYVRVPEALFYLYETFRKDLVSPNHTTIKLRIARVLRANVARRGDSDLVFRLCALGAVLAPLQLLGGIAHLLIPVLGFLGIYQLLSIMRRGPKAVKQIATDYATLTQHGEKLGLQALIGADLRALLRGWIMKPAPTPEMPESGLGPLRPRLALWVAPAVLAVLWAIGLCNGLAITLPNWLKVLIDSDTSATDPKSIVGWTTFAFWCILTIASAVLLKWPKDTTDRILLVVDDLDRCLPEELIDILEAIKLLLEDPALAERVQVLVLVDEEPLDVAIREKFKALIEARGGVESAASTVREHKEKLFLCTLRLPELNTEEVKELLAAYTAAAADVANQVETIETISVRGPSVTPDGEKSPTTSGALDRQASELKSFAPSSLPSPRADLFTKEERDILRDAVVSAIPKGNIGPTPRQIRSFLSKYQIARALCAYRPVSDAGVTPRRLAEGLAKAVFANIAPLVSPDKTEGRFTIADYR